MSGQKTLKTYLKGLEKPERSMYQKILEWFMLKAYQQNRDFRIDMNNTPNCKQFVFQDDSQSIIVAFNEMKNGDDNGKNIFQECMDLYGKFNITLHEKFAKQTTIGNLETTGKKNASFSEVQYNDNIFPKPTNMHNQTLCILFIPNLRRLEETDLSKLLKKKYFEENFILQSLQICSYYSFEIKQTIQFFQLTDSIENHNFLKNFLIVVVDDVVISKAIMSVLKNIVPLENIQDNMYKELHKKMYNYCNRKVLEKEDQCIKQEHLLGCFSNFWSDNLVKKLKKYSEKIDFNDKKIIGEHSVMLIKTERPFLVMVKLYQELNLGQDTEYLFIDTSINLELQYSMIESFKLTEYKYLVCYIGPESKLILPLINIFSGLRKNQRIILLAACDVFPNYQSINRITDEDIFHNCSLAKISNTVNLGCQKELYLNRKLISTCGTFSEQQFFTRVLQGNKVCNLLIGKPGIGKTALLDRFIDYMHEKNLDFKPVYIDRRKCLKHVTNAIENQKPTLNFDSEIFSLPNIVLILDDFELYFNHKHFSNLLRSISNRKNIKHLVLSTTVHLQTVLEQLLETESYTLLPFSIEQHDDYIQKYWSINSKDKNGKNFQNRDKYDSGLPLEISMAGDVNMYPEKSPAINKTSLFENFFDAKRREFIGNEYNKKKSYLKNIYERAFDEIIKELEKSAVRNIVINNNQFLNKKKKKYYLTVHKSNAISLLNNSVDKRLFHKSFEEFLIAKMLWRELKNNKLAEHLSDFLIKKVIEGPSHQFFNLRTFLDQVLHKNGISLQMYTYASSLVDAQIKKKYFVKLFSVVEEGHLNILKLLLEDSKNSINLIIHTYNDRQQNVLELALSLKNPEVLKYLEYLKERGGIRPEYLKRNNSGIHTVVQIFSELMDREITQYAKKYSVNNFSYLMLIGVILISFILFGKKYFDNIFLDLITVCATFTLGIVSTSILNNNRTKDQFHDKA